jgi:hypothetical protein
MARMKSSGLLRDRCQQRREENHVYRIASWPCHDRDACTGECLGVRSLPSEGSNPICSFDALG